MSYDDVITFIQHPSVGEKGVPLVPRFKLRVVFPAFIEANTVTVTAKLDMSDPKDITVHDLTALSVGNAESSKVQILDDGRQQFELEFLSLTFNCTGRFRIQFNVDYYRNQNGGKISYASRIGFDIPVWDVSS